MTLTSRLAAIAVVAALIGGGTLAAAPAASASEPSGTAFGKSCAAVTLLAIPGSNETTKSARMDVAQAMLSNVTDYITKHGDSSIRTHYLGYPARLVPYGDSRAQGYQAAWSTINYYARQCQNTSFILVGYSQGAHIAGDLATTIGKQGSPVAASRVRSVRLLADPARNPNFPVVGSGGRAGGLFPPRGDFGALNARVTEYCNSKDGVCNSSVRSTYDLVTSFGGVHTTYQSTKMPGTNKTYTERITDDLVQDIVNLNGATY